MGFRNRIVRVSQLLADQIIGAAIATAATGPRIVLTARALGEPGRLLFYGTSETDPITLAYQRTLDGGRLTIDHPVALPAGRPLIGLDGTTATYTVTGGTIGIPHSLGAVPSLCVPTPHGTSVGFELAYAKGASTPTTISVTVRNAVGMQPSDGSTVQVSWLAALLVGA